MIIEQPAELNSIARPPAKGKITWGRVWTWVKFASPLLTLAALFSAEFSFLDDSPPAPRSDSPVDVVLFLLLMLVLVLFLVWYSRLEDRRKRSLEWDDTFLRLKPGMKIRWRHLRAFHLEPAGPGGKFTRLTIHHRRGGGNHRWAMILDDPQKRETLIAALDGRRRTCPCDFVIETRNTPNAFPNSAPGSSHPVLDIWLACLGIFLIYNSMPLLAVGFLPPGLLRNISNPNTQSHVNPQITAWLDTHLPTIEARRHAAALIGALLLIVGAACFKFVAPKRETS